MSWELIGILIGVPLAFVGITLYSIALLRAWLRIIQRVNKDLNDIIRRLEAKYKASES